jgi:hypothetical protein
MSFVQRLFTAILPRKWAESMESESRAWVMQCPCGHERSVWEAGGIRYGASGNPRLRVRCPECGRQTWHRVYRKEADPPHDPGDE